VAGLLVTNRFGRPLEFQCTTPVKPNRTQQLLYGPTLIPFILGELTGRTLLEKAAVKPHLVVTDREDILDLRNHVSIPVLCLGSAVAGSPDKQSNLSDGGPAERPSGMADGEHRAQLPAVSAATGDVQTQVDEATQHVQLGRHACQIHPEHLSDRDTVLKAAESVARDANLCEPLERVRAALEETVGSHAGAA